MNCLKYLIVAMTLLSSISARASDASLLDALVLSAPQANPQVIELALQAGACAVRGGLVKPAQRLAVIDYSLPSTQPRLWLFDLKARTLLLNDYVAHGRNSGDNFASSFSNVEGSFQSSLGLFAGLDSYIGRNGRSLRLRGLEPGFNDSALSRAIVLHGADYVTREFAARHGRLGRSHGCPVVRPELNDQVIDALRDGQQFYIYYPDPTWLSRSALLRCSA